MSDDDLIRRGDALRVADEVFDKCENVNGDDRGAFAAAEVGARIAALPAVTVTAPDDPTLEEIVVVLSGWIDRLIRERVDLRQKLAALEPAAITATDATEKGGDAFEDRDSDRPNPATSPGVTAGADAAQAREAALKEAMEGRDG